MTRNKHISMRKILKMFHIISAGIWIGGTATLTALICLYHPDSPESFGAWNSLLKITDLYIIAPGAAGCFVTGTIYSWRYNFGFFRLKWIVAKWMVNIFFIVFGGLFVLPRIDSAIARSESMAAVAEETAVVQALHISINTAQWAVIVFLVFLSVFKPWGKTGFSR